MNTKLNKEQLEIALRLLKQLDEKRKTTKLEHYTPYDFQKNFHHAEGYQTPGKLADIRALVAANQIGKCVTAKTLIDTPKGKVRADQIKRGDEIFSWDDGVVKSHVGALVRKPAEACYRVWLDNGQWFECAARHRILTRDGYAFFDSLMPYLRCLPQSSEVAYPLESLEDVQYYFRTLQDFPDDYQKNCHSSDAPLLQAANIDQSFFLQQADVLKRNGFLLRMGDLVGKCKHTLQQLFFRLSNWCADRLDVGRCFEFQSQVAYNVDKQSHDYNQVLKQLSIAAFFQPQQVAAVFSRLFEVFSLANSHKSTYNSIVCYQPIGTQDIYDFWVPEYGNYIAAGIVHHNTRCGSMEIAMHLTGIYPTWWKGRKFTRPVDCLVASNTNETTRDICQEALFGDPADDDALGTGAIPRDCIGERTSKPGVPNAYDVVLVKHITGGWSKVQFKAYEQGFKKFMGKPRDVNWLDEEPPQDVYAQVIRGTFARKDTVTLITLTPEEGMTEVVRQFLEELRPGQSVIRATWDDAPHMTPEMRASKLEAIPVHQREMRSRGVPLMGAGVVFPFPDDEITVEPFEIPRHWPQIIGIDFGYNHPFAACNLAYDRDSDCIYITADYRDSLKTPPIHAAAIKPWGEWKPVAWPHDGLNTEKGTGDELRQAYINAGLNMLPWKATNPPQAGQKEGEGGNSVEASLLEMFERLDSGRLKVFKTCRFWLEERRGYHRNVKGKLVALFDDTISASRYGVMMIRHARVKVAKRPQQQIALGASNW